MKTSLCFFFQQTIQEAGKNSIDRFRFFNVRKTFKQLVQFIGGFSGKSKFTGFRRSALPVINVKSFPFYTVGTIFFSFDRINIDNTILKTKLITK